MLHNVRRQHSPDYRQRVEAAIRSSRLNDARAPTSDKSNLFQRRSVRSFSIRDFFRSRVALLVHFSTVVPDDLHKPHPLILFNDLDELAKRDRLLRIVTWAFASASKRGSLTDILAGLDRYKRDKPPELEQFQRLGIAAASVPPVIDDAAISGIAASNKLVLGLHARLGGRRALRERRDKRIVGRIGRVIDRLRRGRVVVRCAVGRIADDATEHARQ